MLDSIRSTLTPEPDPLRPSHERVRLGFASDAGPCAAVDALARDRPPWRESAFAAWHNGGDHNEWAVYLRDGVAGGYLLLAWSGRRWEVVRFGSSAAAAERPAVARKLMAGFLVERNRPETIAALVPEADMDALATFASWRMSSRLVRRRGGDLVEFRWPRSDAAGCRGVGR